MNFIWFSGLIKSVPTGILAAAVYALFVAFFRNLKKGNLTGLGLEYLTPKDIVVMGIIVLAFMVIFFLGNLIKYLSGQTDFRPASRRSVTEISKDKKTAQNHAVPKQYLSRIPSGLTIGKYRGTFVTIPFLNSPEHQLFLGAPGSNKSTTILNALLYNFNFADAGERLHSVLAVDCKPELSRLSVYEGRKDVRIINPSDVHSFGFDVYYGLTGATPDDELKERFDMISRTLIVNPGGHDAFFYISAQTILTAILMYGFRKGRSFTDSIMSCMDVSIEDMIAEILTDEEMEKHPKIRRLVKSFDGKTSNAFQDIVMTMQQELSIFDTESVKHCFDPHNPKKTSPEDLMGGISLFLAIPDRLLKLYSPIFRMIIQMCLKHLVGVPEWTRKGQRPIWFLIDEAGSIGPLPDLVEEGLPRARSKGCQITLVCQSFAQLEATYGKENARAIMDCCKSTVVLSCNDTQTAKALSDWTGTYRETKKSTTKKPTTLMAGVSSTSESVEYRPVMDVADIKNLEKYFKALVFSKGDWFLIDKAPYYQIEMLRKKSEEIQKKNRKYYAD